MVSEPLRLHAFDDVDAFANVAFPFLLRREAEHNLILGLCELIRVGVYTDPFLAVVERGGNVEGVALRTPPHNLALSHLDDPAIVEVVVDDARRRFGTLPGVLAHKDDAARFAQAWSAATGATAEIFMRQRIYEADRVEAPAVVPGGMRDATRGDRDQLIAWFRAFAEEAGDMLPDGPEPLVDRRLESTGDERLVLWWTDGPTPRPVSMAATSGPTPNGIRINAVYTPPEERNRGYATACVAALTQRMLDGGRRFCFLYTDLSNPTSNGIYQRVGYRPVADVDQYRFG